MSLLPTVNALLGSMNMGPLTVHRAGEPTQNERGSFDAAADEPFELNPATVHTLGGRDLEQVPEADRNRETIQVYAKERLHVGDGGKTADRIEYRGRTFRVIKVEDYELAGDVYLALAVMEDV